MIRVREYARLTTDPEAPSGLDCGVVSEYTFEWLMDLSSAWKGAEPIAVINGRHSLKLGSHVGFLQSPNGEAIEILPKTGLGLEDSKRGRRILQQMLLTAMGIKPRAASAADLLRLDEPLHEWIFGQFLVELQQLVSRGLRFDYKRVDEDSRFIRGQLELAKQQRQPPGKAHLFNINHDIYSPDRLENRLLATALHYARAHVKNNANWRLASELSHQLSEIPVENSPLASLKRWHDSRHLRSYEGVKPWCILVLEKLNPNFQSGQHQGISLLFPMEQLFERYVEDALRPKVGIDNYQLTAQASSRYLLRHTPANTTGAVDMFQLKPDFFVKTSYGNHVLDTKWKLLNQAAFDAKDKYGMHQADLYQMFGYGHKYLSGTGHMMLIYPVHEQFTMPLPRFTYSDDLTIWAVPFCLDSRTLIKGEWQDAITCLQAP